MHLVFSVPAIANDTTTVYESSGPFGPLTTTDLRATRVRALAGATRIVIDLGDYMLVKKPSPEYRPALGDRIKETLYSDKGTLGDDEFVVAKLSGREELFAVQLTGTPETGLGEVHPIGFLSKPIVKVND